MITPKNGPKNQSSSVAMGAVHLLPFKMQQYLLALSIINAPKMEPDTEKALLEQQKEEQHQEKILQKKRFCKRRLYPCFVFIIKYNFAVYWRTEDQVDSELEQLDIVKYWAF
eukprot:13858222-Ditylum_brightwellii.AAC.1